MHAGLPETLSGCLNQLSWNVHAFQCRSSLRHSLVTLQRPLVIHGRQKRQIGKHLTAAQADSKDVQNLKMLHASCGQAFAK